MMIFLSQKHDVQGKSVNSTLCGKVRQSEMKELVTKIKLFREKCNMTQKELADRVDVRRETIVRLEQGKYNPSLKLAADIAKVFDTAIENIFSYEEQEKTNTESGVKK